MLFTNHDSFLSELSRLFEQGRQSNKSVWIIMKRYDGRTTRNPRKPNDKPKRPKKGSSQTIARMCKGGDLMPNEYKCLIRAKLGDRKISAVIGQKDLNKFQQSYSNLIKGNIYGLKKQKTTQGSSSNQMSSQHPLSTQTSLKTSGGVGTSQSK